MFKTEEIFYLFKKIPKQIIISDEPFCNCQTPHFGFFIKHYTSRDGVLLDDIYHDYINLEKRNLEYLTKIINHGFIEWENSRGNLINWKFDLNDCKTGYFGCFIEIDIENHVFSGNFSQCIEYLKGKFNV